jgi:hypothetical protein
MPNATLKPRPQVDAPARPVLERLVVFRPMAEK